jgi:hypothetical protein
VYCCGGEKNVYCCCGAEESKEGDGEEEKNGDVAAALPHAVAPVGVPSAYSCGGSDETKRCDSDAAATRRRRGFMASGKVTENRAAVRSSVGSVKAK